jgi:hypothetical protein
MRPLDLDHLRPAGRAPWVRYALAAAALAFGADQVVYYRSLGNAVAAMETTLASAKLIPARPASPLRTVGTEEAALARDTIGRLAAPWERLFGALESAHTEQIALLSIEPDAEARTVTISGEAKDYLAALSYLAGLAEQPALRRVHLVRHENQRSGGPRPLAFTISAAWREVP